MKSQEFITPVDQYIIDFVRQLRDKKTLTQKEIATIIGVSREFIKDVENTNKRAKYNFRHINSLADHFDMSPRDFLPEKPMKQFSDNSGSPKASKMPIVKKETNKKKKAILKKPSKPGR